MAQRRAHGSCPHGDAGRRPYPVWPNDGWDLDVDADRDAALAKLETALTACSYALAPAAAALTTQDVRHALKAVPLELRPMVLRPLGLTLKPRQISQGLCQDVRGRLARADDHALHHALAALGTTALLDMRLAAARDEFPPEIAEDLRDPAVHWGETLCRSTVWAAALSSVVDARLWQWAAQQPWFAPDGAPAEPVAAIVAAAEHVIELTPEYTHLPRAAVASRADAEVHATDAAPSESPLPESTTPMTSPAATVDSAASAALPGAANAFDAALTAAVPAAERITAALREKCPPLPEDVQLVALTRQRFDEAAGLAAAAGQHIAQDSAAALHAAVAAAGADAGDDEVRALLDAVLSLAAPDGSPLTAALQAAQQQATALLALRPWDAAARADAHVLSLLVALTSADLDATGRLELITQVAQTSPALAGLAVQADQLIAAAPPTAPVPAAAAGAAAAPTDAVAEAATPEAPSAAVPTTLTAQAEPLEPAATDSSTSDPAVTELAAAPEPPPAAPVARLAPAAQVPEQLPAPETADATDELDETQVEAAVEEGLAALVADNRFGLAVAVCAADDEAPVRQAALRIAALAKVVRHQNGPVAAALRAEFDALDADTVAADTPSLLLTVPSLVSAALVTGEPTIGALLTDLATRVEPNLSAIAEEVGQRTLKGVLLDAQALSVVADVTEAERDLHTIMATAYQVRTRHRTLRFKRATDISKVLLGHSGILGKPLAAVERNDLSALDDVVADLARLTDSSYLRSTIDTLDRRFQGSSGKPIEGAGRQDLLNLVSEALSPLADWVETVRAIGVQQTRGQHWSAAEIATLRTLVLDRATAALGALEAQLSHPDALTAAAARAAHASLTGTFAVLDGTGVLPAGEPSPQQALTVELLRVPGATVDVALGAVTAPAGTTATDLLAAVTRDWDACLRAQIAAENFEAAYFLLTAGAAGQLPATRSADGTLDDALALTLTDADVTAAEKAVRQQLTDDRELFSATLRRARLNNEISDEQDGELAGLLRDAHAGLAARDLASVRTILDRAAELLPSYRAEAKSRLTDRLDALRADGRVDDATMTRLANLMDDGQLSTAEELIYFLEIDEDVPEVYQSEDLQRFFPAVPDAMPRGITRELVQLVSARGQLPACPVLDFSELSPDLAALGSDALNAWRQLGAADPDQRSRINESDMIAPALRLIGLEARRHKRLDDLPRSRDRRLVEFPVEEILGKALVPAFGSKLGNRLRVLLAWGQPSADLLMSWADTDPSGESLLIAHFGTMSAQTRRDLAVKAARRPAPIVVLDDAALAYLAAHGNRQMTATMNVLLPFSSINPYLRQKRGVVAPEMFYGRDAERRSVLDPDGTQLVFGGRGLGKSALLNSAAEQFEKQASVGERIAVYLDLKAVGIRRESAIDQEAIWDALLAELTRRNLITATGRSGRRGTPRYAACAGRCAGLDRRRPAPPTARPARRGRPVLRSRHAALHGDDPAEIARAGEREPRQGRVRRSALGAAVRQDGPQRAVRAHGSAPDRHRSAASAACREPADPTDGSARLRLRRSRFGQPRPWVLLLPAVPVADLREPPDRSAARQARHRRPRRHRTAVRDRPRRRRSGRDARRPARRHPYRVPRDAEPRPPLRPHRACPRAARA